VLERNLWEKFRRHLHAPSLGRVAKKVQDAYQRGMPDVIATVEGRVTWLELKYFARWPVRGGPLAWANDERATNQRAWLREWVERGGGHGAWLLGVGEEWLLLPYDTPGVETRAGLIEWSLIVGGANDRRRIITFMREHHESLGFRRR
jgi:hypothetical protein